MDYTRIGELFYPHIKRYKEGAIPQVDLGLFITHAVAAFRQSGRIKNDGTKRFVYSGNEEKYRLALSLVSADRKVELTEISMGGESDNLIPPLSLLNGNLNAEFSEMYLELLENNLKQKLMRNGRGNISQLGQLNVYLAPSPDDQILVRKAEWQNPAPPSFSGNTDKPLESLLGKDSIALLSRAGSIQVNNSFYIDGNCDQELIHESGSIAQPSPGIYLWNYQIKTANGSGLPGALLDRLNRWFDLIKSRFDPRPYSLLEVVEESSAREEDSLPW